jgi:hypothetical protein
VYRITERVDWSEMGCGAGWDGMDMDKLVEVQEEGVHIHTATELSSLSMLRDRALLTGMNGSPVSDCLVCRRCWEE